LETIDQLLAFQEDEIVSQALENEMDLREYAKQIAEEKISVQRDLENNCKVGQKRTIDLLMRI
jgi:hypothetical protein